jgi:hypothetical protein
MNAVDQLQHAFIFERLGDRWQRIQRYRLFARLPPLVSFNVDCPAKGRKLADDDLRLTERRSFV